MPRKPPNLSPESSQEFSRLLKKLLFASHAVKNIGQFVDNFDFNLQSVQELVVQEENLLCYLKQFEEAQESLLCLTIDEPVDADFMLSDNFLNQVMHIQANIRILTIQYGFPADLINREQAPRQLPIKTPAIELPFVSGEYSSCLSSEKLSLVQIDTDGTLEAIKEAQKVVAPAQNIPSTSNPQPLNSGTNTFVTSNYNSDNNNKSEHHLFACFEQSHQMLHAENSNSRHHRQLHNGLEFSRGFSPGSSSQISLTSKFPHLRRSPPLLKQKSLISCQNSKRNSDVKQAATKLGRLPKDEPDPPKIHYFEIFLLIIFQGGRHVTRFLHPFLRIVNYL